MPKTYDVELTDEMIEEISMVLPKLKHAVTLDRVIEWLSMFEKQDQMIALEILFFMEYISCEEMQMRFNDLLSDVFNEVNDPILQTLIIPIGEDGKSGDLMKYFIKRTRAYKNRKGKILMGSHLIKENVTKESILILLDDFIGSGNSTIKDIQKRNIDNWINYSSITKTFVITLLSLEAGKKKIEEHFPKFNVRSGNRFKAFSHKNSSFEIKYGVNVTRDVAIKYGNLLPIDREKNLAPLGYESSEALVAFPFGCPNNTLPIMWSTYSGWKAIFPRSPGIRMDYARAVKRDVAYWIGIMHRLKIAIDEDKNLLISGKKRRYGSKKDHSLLTYLKLRTSGYENPIICQILGITTHELRAIISAGVQKSYLKKSGEITNLGNEYFQKLMTLIKSNNINTLVSNNLQIMGAEEYIKKKYPGNKGIG